MLRDGRKYHEEIDDHRGTLVKMLGRREEESHRRNHDDAATNPEQPTQDTCHEPDSQQRPRIWIHTKPHSPRGCRHQSLA